MTENRSSLPDVLQHWQAAILDASQRQSCLRVRGMGSKDHVGYPSGGEILDTRVWQGIASYEPSELVVTARAGTPLPEVEALLASQGQYLAFEPPRGVSGAQGTLGGVVASGLSGPSRVSRGAVRDHVLGVRMFNGRGEHLRFGGTVMKNVAGFDLSRLMAGSMGTLGLMTEVTLKVLPWPVASQTLRFQMSQAHAIDTVNRWAGQPLPLDASCWWRGTLLLRLQGARAAVQAATVCLAQEAFGEPLTDADDAPGFWATVRDQQHVFFSRTDKPLWRVALPATHPPLLLPGHPLEDGDELIEWWGGQRWVYADAAPEVVCSAAVSAGGHAILWRSPAAHSAGLMAQMAAAGAALASPVMHQWHRQIQQAFDPNGVFNTGRLWPAAPR